MSKTPDGREIFVWRDLDPAKETHRLAVTIANECVIKLFLVNGSVRWFDGSRPIPIGRTRLHEIITEVIATERLVDRGSENWEIEFHPFDFAPGTDSSQGPDDRVLSNILEELKSLIAKGPIQPLNKYQSDQARSRLQQGEPPSSVASGMGIDIELVKQLRSQR
jgi:hypothetical protein